MISNLIFCSSTYIKSTWKDELRWCGAIIQALGLKLLSMCSSFFIKVPALLCPSPQLVSMNIQTRDRNQNQMERKIEIETELNHNTNSVAIDLYFLDQDVVCSGIAIRERGRPPHLKVGANESLWLSASLIGAMSNTANNCNSWKIHSHK